MRFGCPICKEVEVRRREGLVSLLHVNGRRTYGIGYGILKGGMVLLHEFNGMELNGGMDGGTGRLGRRWYFYFSGLFFYLLFGL